MIAGWPGRIAGRPPAGPRSTIVRARRSVRSRVNPREPNWGNAGNAAASSRGGGQSQQTRSPDPGGC